jgi:hypothetical protein
MTQAFYLTKFTQWHDDGFTRRFLWSFFRLANSNAITQAIVNETKIEFLNGRGFNPKIPTSNTIPQQCSKIEAEHLHRLLRYQDSQEIGLVLLKKILSALKWKFQKDKITPMGLLEDFCTSLTKEGATLKI